MEKNNQIEERIGISNNTLKLLNSCFSLSELINHIKNEISNPEQKPEIRKRILSKIKWICMFNQHILEQHSKKKTLIIIRCQRRYDNDRRFFVSNEYLIRRNKFNEL